LLDGDKGVDEDGVSLASDKCRQYTTTSAVSCPEPGRS
jgi:hypothetical protein